MKAFILTLAVVALSGCSLIAPKIGPKVAKAVNRYCEEPHSNRVFLRNEINSMIDPNHIKVTCAGDPEE